MLKTLCIKFPGLGEPGSAGPVYQMENSGEAKETMPFPEYQKSAGWELNLLGSQHRVTDGKNCQTRAVGTRRGRRPLTTGSLTSRLFPRPALLFSVTVLFFRSTSLSWKPFPTRRMLLPTLPRPWWSSWLPGAECLKTEVGKQLKSSWERYQTAWQDENAHSFSS